MGGGGGLGGGAIGGGGGFNAPNLLGGGRGGMNSQALGGVNPMALPGSGSAGGAMGGGLPALRPEQMQALMGSFQNPMAMMPPNVPDRGVIGGNMLGSFQAPGTGTPLPGRAFGAGGPGTGTLVGAPLRDREVGITRVQAPPLQVAPPVAGMTAGVGTVPLRGMQTLASGGAPAVPQRGGAGMMAPPTVPPPMSPEMQQRLRQQQASLAQALFSREYGTQ